jgi:hypothetical protein
MELADWSGLASTLFQISSDQWQLLLKLLQAATDCYISYASELFRTPLND